MIVDLKTLNMQRIDLVADSEKANLNLAHSKEQFSNHPLVREKTLNDFDAKTKKLEILSSARPDERKKIFSKLEETSNRLSIQFEKSRTKIESINAKIVAIDAQIAALTDENSKAKRA